MAEEKEVAAIPLVEERVSVGKREVETARYRVRVALEEREEIVPVELARDEVEIERVPRNIALRELPSVRLEGSTTIIPVVEEVVVVEKKLVLVEEIHIRRKTSTQTEQIPVTVRAEQALIEQEPSGAAAPGAPAEEPAEERVQL
ncbi:MAG TPA: DUF2382 domain-containing protein [Allosphingosinicella sp.]|jgi:uncharacterized protein (TIGR02271 family)